MIDPTNITNCNASTPQLQELILFWVCAAGKNGVTAAKCLDNLLQSWREVMDDKFAIPFDVINYILQNGDLACEMKRFGIGCYNNKSKTFKYLVYSNLDLKSCGVEDLESIPGIGPKTARCFLIHSRKNQNYAGLDTHILKFLRDKGYDVPKSTPSGKRYAYLEEVFLNLAADSGVSVAEFDLKIWNEYRLK